MVLSTGTTLHTVNVTGCMYSPFFVGVPFSSEGAAVVSLYAAEGGETKTQWPSIPTSNSQAQLFSLLHCMFPCIPTGTPVMNGLSCYE
jgi:hypothetical protein